MQVAHSPVEIGDVLADKYRVERVLGVGGMGVVVEALHLELERRVALKFMLGAATDTEAMARFMREGKAAARLRSEHVVQVLDVGKLGGGEPYMVMELLEGRDLSDLIEQEGPQPVDRAVSFVLHACKAVSEAHAAGIVHRDLKPSNLFLTSRPDGTWLVKVLDFGISKMDRSPIGGEQSVNVTSTRAMLGSPAYMSPEQVRSAKRVDARTDIWSLGVILYELLTARTPFDADSLSGLIAAIVSDPPVPVDQYRGELPAGLSAVVMRCLDKEPSARHESVAALARALEPYALSKASGLVTCVDRPQGFAGSSNLGDTLPAALVSVEASVREQTSPRGKRGIWIALLALILALFDQFRAA